LPYIDARCVQDRLDAVVGAANWQDDYEFLPDGSVLCRLSLRLGGEWIVKADVGGPSEQPDEGDRHKAAVSDALKRAAVKWGIGRYLYRLPQQWCDFDLAKKRFVQQPALPSASPATPAAATPMNGKSTEQSSAPALAPASVTELASRLHAFGVALVKAGLCHRADELLAFVREQLGVEQSDPAAWPVHLIEHAMRAAKAFEAQCRQHASRNRATRP
jgi:hypothetical protein